MPTTMTSDVGVAADSWHEADAFARWIGFQLPTACVTPAGHSRLTDRNLYPPGARWPFAGLRPAADR
jgi:formylglycine-generating enzyme required for sulfatase activity